MRSNRTKDIKVGEYLIIGIVSFCEYQFNELEYLIDLALKKENLPWGATKIVIQRNDPSVEHINKQFHQTKFAGIAWTDTVDEILECHCLIVAGKTRKHRVMYDKLSNKTQNLRRRKYIDLI